jgi:hypothetical protein
LKVEYKLAETFFAYTADGTANSWAIPFNYLSTEHVGLFVDGVEDETKTFLTASSLAATSVPTNGASVLVKRTTPRDTLITEIPNSGSYRGQDLNNQSLQALYIAQEAYDALTSVFSLDATDNKWDGDNKNIKDVLDPTNDQDAATKAYVDSINASDIATINAALASVTTLAAEALTSKNAAATSASSASTSETNSSTSATASAASEANAETAKTDAETAETNAVAAQTAAETAKTGAETAETNAGSSATASAASATAAAASATASSTAQTAAETAQTAAEAAKTGAETAETNAEAALTSFNGVWCGVQASDPTNDANGDPVTEGDFYWNSASKALKFHNGTTFVTYSASSGGDVSGPASSTDDAIAQFDGTTGKLLKDGPAIGTSANNIVQLDGTGKLPALDGSALTNLPSPEVLIVANEQSSGTDGGGFTSGAWRTRVLNVEQKNTITGASLASNQVTLPAGDYIVEGYAIGHACNHSKTKIYNDTDSTDVCIGSSRYSSQTNAGNTAVSVSGAFTLAAEKNLELQHRCTTTRVTNGLGLGLGYGVVEVYSVVKFTKVG